MTLNQTLLLILLAAIWGASFMFMRVATPEMGPIALIGFRALIGFATLLPFLLFRRGFADLRRHWQGIFIVGMTNTAIPFVLLAYATLTLSAGLTSILNATAPIFAALVGFVWLKQRLTINKTTGLMLGFIGILTLFAGKGDFAIDATAIAIFAGLIAGLNYGFAACYTGKYLSKVNSMSVAVGSQFFAALVYLPILPFFMPEQAISEQAIVATIVLGAICTALAYIIYFYLIKEVGPDKSISVAYLIPVFGVFWGMIFLDEQLTMSMLIGAVLILAGVGMTTGVLKRKSKKVLD
ncbi:EamA/RhaT family transporter [Thalassotalea sp. HSM 43]|uniref:DMT family transporter n=1 Tax=Thalassotalea sp. HSM 43 TaxID=2552945 RepID=UPI001081A221|nr:EamA family transporter [Thalassotalea sp. HSM 43]QBY05427.1 EamA/RhaT family transporter [Thalassotalea sp. HSM 43]